MCQEQYFIPRKNNSIDENLKTEVYYGIYETKFNLRYANHKKLFNHRNRKSDTELSNEF